MAESGKVKACTGRISEQLGKDIPGQYLPGGAQQAIFEMSESSARTLAQVGKEVIASGATRTLTLDGIEFTLRPTGWKDANGVWGYLHMPGPGTVQTSRLGTREQASKEEERSKTSHAQ